MKIQTFTIKGTKAEDTILPKEFGIKVNLPLLAQAVYVYEKRAHVGLRKTKTRAEVERTSKKIYKQKGTGGARHGSRRAPIFVGGGVALGPRPVKRMVSIPDDIKNKAKFMAFAMKAEEKKMVAVSGISKITKTKEIVDLVKLLRKETSAQKITFILSDKSEGAVRSIRNLAGTGCVFYKNANALDIYEGGLIVMDEEIFLGNKKEEKDQKTLKQFQKTVKKTNKKPSSNKPS